MTGDRGAETEGAADVCEHTEHAIRSGGRYGRFFPEGSVSLGGEWEPCPKAPATGAAVEWEQVNYLLAPTFRVVVEDDGWRVFKRVEAQRGGFSDG